MARSLKLGLVGTGRMGRALEAVAGDRGHQIAVKWDGKAASEPSRAALTQLDGALEFTHADVAAELCRCLLDCGVPVVSGTTGWQARLEQVQAVARERRVGFLWAPNFSLGMQIMFHLAEQAAAAFSALDGYTPYLVEYHHERKEDAPSGTARRLAGQVLEVTPGRSRWGTPPSNGPLPDDLMPVAWVRAGTIPGTHQLGWDGPAESLELIHRVRDRAVFAQGALRAMEWLVRREGPHTLDEMLDVRG
ncbi:MAG: 4-hydroxy-tetrahydrodipicolinate reductase [Acidobacteriota bacterium]|nr:MAG: 4-hydroxy-tetrahydrodipicolinate reductase [Acidobacteriota bacterium]